MAQLTTHDDVTTAGRVGARAGLAARGVIYLLVGVIAASLAWRGHGKHADQRGALTDLAGQPSGKLLVILVAIGLAAYALWQLSQVFTGVVGENDTKGKRLRSLASFIVYASLTFSAISVLSGSRTSQGSQQEGITAKVMRHSGGRWLVGIVGAVIVVIGVVLVIQGAKATFMKRLQRLPRKAADGIKRLGQVGTVARGVVFALVGVLLVNAARTYEPSKARGIDGALRTLLQQPYGRWLTGLAALGLFAFGLFGLVESRYRKV